MKLTGIKGTLTKAGVRVLAQNNYAARSGVKVRLTNAYGYPVKAADACRATVTPIGLDDTQKAILEMSLKLAGYVTEWEQVDNWRVAPLVVKVAANA